jgi:hypothetical protein
MHSLDNWVNNTLHELIGGAFDVRYSWHVAFGSKQHGLRVVLPTNPLGALKLFKDRQLTEGQTRRNALKHWVANHYYDHAEAGTVYVRDHLRGHTEFLWNDLNCELMVSAYDLEKNEAFKEEARLWRANRKHNRVRVKLKRNK